MNFIFQILTTFTRSLGYWVISAIIAFSLLSALEKPEKKSPEAFKPAPLVKLTMIAR